MCLVAGFSVSGDDNDTNGQCSMHSSVGFKNSIWQEDVLEMNEKRGGKRKKGPGVLCNWENVGHLVGIGVNVGLPLFLACVGRALMMSCVSFYSGILCGRPGPGTQLQGDFERVLVIYRGTRKALNTDEKISDVSER